MRAVVIALGFGTILSGAAFAQYGGAYRIADMGAQTEPAQRVVAQATLFDGPRIVLAQAAPQANYPQTSWEFGPQQEVYPVGQ